MTKKKKKKTNTENRNEGFINGEGSLVASSSQPNVHPKFLEAQNKFTDVIKKNLENNEYLLSSEEEDLEQDVLDGIMDKLLASYKKTGADTKQNLDKTNKYLGDAINSGAAVCLICIATIKRSDAIWSCKSCYCFFHLDCIQRWGRDNVAQKRLRHDELLIDVLPPNLTFACPKCRHEYTEKEIPTRYLCFCGAKGDPPVDPWLVPHSCGEHCQKPLVPDCGDLCLLLCHPGPCPPCPKLVKSICACGQSTQLQRCSNRAWTCKLVCNKVLSCEVHKCKLPCHTGSCQPCPEQSLQSCLCQAQSTTRPCSQPKWQCDKKCENVLSCGIHKCDTVCHKAPCTPCQLSEERLCPCGKKTFKLPCTEDIPSCGDTCGKTLDCGAHKCNMRCHKGSCGVCLETSVKKCRCGVKEKEVPCAKEFLCETKCKRIRNCYTHPCNRKCCDGDCRPCEKPCAKQLSCGKHKCAQLCHIGPCFPCSLTDTVKCSCGDKRIIVSCGAKKKTKPPKCQCRLKPKCNHLRSSPHRCHLGDCPPCSQICGIEFECGHLCPMRCHTNMLVDLSVDKVPAGPWEVIQPEYVRKSTPCGDCKVPVNVSCFGGHETRTLPCFRKEYSCKSTCNFRLACGNHFCTRVCHVKQISPDNPEISLNCTPCTDKCTRPRPLSCNHPCRLGCHNDPCPPCEFKIKTKCHCGINFVYISCSKWSNASEENKSVLLSCDAGCPKLLSCGHKCPSHLKCHTGPCPDASNCKELVKVKCPCNRISSKVACADKERELIQCNAQCEKSAKSSPSFIKPEVNSKSSESKLTHRKNEPSLKKKQDDFLFKNEVSKDTNGDEEEANSTIVNLVFIFISIVILLLVLYLLF